jgi:hypothetical protein
VIPFPAPPAGPTCSVCGCTPQTRCEMDHRRRPGRLPADPVERMVQRTLRVLGPLERCSPVYTLAEPDSEDEDVVCTRCMLRDHLPRDLGILGTLSRRQACELHRIMARHGGHVSAELAGAAGRLVVSIEHRERRITIPR